jgi:hypothetical protein
MANTTLERCENKKRMSEPSKNSQLPQHNKRDQLDIYGVLLVADLLLTVLFKVCVFYAIIVSIMYVIAFIAPRGRVKGPTWLYVLMLVSLGPIYFLRKWVRSKLAGSKQGLLE